MEMRGAAGISPESHDAIRRFVDPTGWEHLEPLRDAAEAWRTFRRLRTGICELFEALAEERPLVLAIDDVHWIDPRSLEVLAELSDRVRRRVVFVLTSRESVIEKRTGSLAALCSRAAVRRLEGLGDVEVESLLSQIAEQRNLVLARQFVRRIIAASAGNPLFVSELTTHYAWNGLGDGLPHNLQTLLQKRLEVLSSDALLVFQACGVLGEHSTVEQIGNVLQIPTHSLLRALAELESKSLFSVEPSRVVCRHELLRKEALSKLTPLARQALYRKAALVLESAALQEMSTAMGWHAVHAWLDAAQPSRALRLVTKMAGRLLSAGLAQDADALLEKARAVMRELPVVMDLLPLQLQAAWARGDLRRSLDLALECQRLSHQMPTRLRDAHLAELTAFDASRGLEAMRPRFDLDLRRIESAVEPPDDLVELALRIVIAADDCLDPGMAQECFALLNKRRILERSRFDRKVIFQLVYHSHFGDLEFAVDCARLIIAPNQRQGKQDLSTKARRLRWAHRPLLISGLFDEAISALDQSIAVAKSCGSRLDEVASCCVRLDSLVAADRLDEALQTMADLDALSTSDCGQLVQTTAFGARADLLFALGRLEELHNIMCIVNSDVQPREHTRTRLGIDALHLLQAFARHRDVDECRVSRILDSWSAMRGMGAADTVFLALLAALLRRGDIEKARVVCLDYSRSRRERWPIPESTLRQFGAVLLTLGVEAPSELELFAGGRELRGS
jgi:hypothetical protein